MWSMKQFLASLVEILEIAFIAIASVFIIRTFLLQPFLVSGASMEPNFSSDDYLLIDELTYRLREPERGEVVVFRYPFNESVYYIKRIIGLPGEKVIVKNGLVTIVNQDAPQGFLVKEEYLPRGLITGGNEEVTLGPSEYFVMGDNRPASSDSRAWGPVPKKDIIGLARLRLWPLTKATAFETPSYQTN